MSVLFIFVLSLLERKHSSVVEEGTFSFNHNSSSRAVKSKRKVKQNLYLSVNVYSL